MGAGRVVIALVVALLLSGGATYFVYTRMLQQNQSQIQFTKIVITAKSVPAGVPLKAEDLQLADWPTNLPLNGSFSKIEDVKDRPAIYPLAEREPVLERDLAVPGSGIGLTVKIPPGMRATSIRSNEIVGVAGFLYPGSHVDVLATYTPVGSNSPITQTVLQDVEVLTAGQKIQPDPQGKPETVSVVTLLLSPEDSEKLLLASSLGTIQFVLRNGSDSKRPEIRAANVSGLLSGSKPEAPRPAPSTSTRRARVVAPPPPKPPAFFMVEVINGDKRSTEKFQATADQQ
jgi:pilus assembly protein CpaB